MSYGLRLLSSAAILASLFLFLLRQYLPESSSSYASKRPLHIAITETNGWHDEVVAALVHAFGSQKNAQLRIYQQDQRYGIAEIMTAFELANPLPDNQSPNLLKNPGQDDAIPEFLVTATCETDILHLSSYLEDLLKFGKTYIFCVVHHADRWSQPDLESAAQTWIEKGRMTFITLSPHTAEYLVRSMSSWKTTITPPIRSFAPLFPVIPLTETNDEGELAFAIQGNYEPSRRNYQTIFSHLESFISVDSEGKEGNTSNINLRLLGHGDHPDVPASLTSHVFFDEGLAYNEYYGLLSRTFTVLTAFANKEYLDRKASSSVPAALIGGTPLVATQELLEAYKYLPEDAVYLQRGNETEFDVVRRVLEGSEKDRRVKASLVQKGREQIIQDNVKMVGKWLTEAESKLGS